MDEAAMGAFRIEDYRLLSSACPSRRELLLATGELWAREPGGDELLALARSDPRPGSARLGRRGLMFARNTEAIAAAASDLSSPDRAIVLMAMLDLALAGSAAREHVAAIIQAADADARTRDDALPYVLGAIGGDRAVARLVTDLRSPRVDIRPVILSLEALGQDAAVSAAPVLHEVATTHYLADVRRAAARAYGRLSGTYLEPELVPCPRSVTESAAGWTVQMAGGPLRFARVSWPRADDGEHARRDEAGVCLSAMTKYNGYIALRTQAYCLVGVNRGEFGGVVLAIDDAGKAQQVVRGNPVRFIDEGPRGILLFEGINHISLDRGSVHRLARQADGTWHADPVALLEVNPVGFTRDADGRLLLLARNSEQLYVCDAPLACRDRPNYVVVRVGDDGRVDVLK
jgi:hypothetical protein